MKDKKQDYKATCCPHCNKEIHINESSQNDKMRIICPACRENFLVNLMNMKTIKRVGDNETSLKHKLKCPLCGKHYLFYELKIDEIISDICRKCGCIFRGNKLYGKTWIAKSQSYLVQLFKILYLSSTY